MVSYRKDSHCVIEWGIKTMKGAIMKQFSAYDGMPEDEFFNKLREMFLFFNKRVRWVNLEEEKERELVFGLFIKLRRGINPKGNGNQRQRAGKSKGRTQKQRYENLYRRCRDAINGILKKCNYQPVVPGKAAGGSGVHHIPAEIKVLVYYMAYRAIELYDHAKDKTSLKKPTQRAVLEFIGNPVMANGKKVYQGYRFSDKTFTYFGISPSVFYSINNYRQIELPTSYAGAKVRHLGYCINYLTAFAGTVDCFVDLFGGSGSATMALHQQDTVEYYINEYDFFVSNYHRVLKDPILYSGFIKELEKVAGKLREANYDVKMGKDFFHTCEEGQEDWGQRYPAGQSDIFYWKGVTVSGNVQRWGGDLDEDKTDMAVAYVYMHCFPVTGGKMDAGAVRENKLARLCQYKREEYDLLHTKFKRLDGIYCADVFRSQKQGMSIIKYFTDKAPDKFRKVEQASKDIRKGVSLEKALKGIGESKEAMEQLRLLGYTKGKQPRPFRTLFYSDSPYLETVGYKIGGIDRGKMKYLIRQLVGASKEGSHFIFSCRATKSVEDGTYSKIASVLRPMEEFRRNNEGEVCLELGKKWGDFQYPEEDGTLKTYSAKSSMNKLLDLLKSNQSIYKDLFKVFLKQAQKGLVECYVLVCINKKAIEAANKQYKRKGKKLVTTVDEQVKVMLQRLFITEVFITDYDFIQPLDYGKYRFAKYGLEDFCKLLKNYLLRSSLYGKTKVKKKGDGYIFE